ncbi:MAG: DUF3822 family protein [Bacteroidales bacterium]|nr:MAG: DUF3822 family protein [Bacteroidales bacterium]
MENKEIFDETFDVNRSESYILTVQVSMEGISFCINDIVRGMYISLISSPFSSPLSESNDWANTVSQYISQFDILSLKYKKVLLCFESTLYTIVPTELFKPERAKELFELVHPLPNLHEIRFNHLAESKSTVIFAIPSSLTARWLTQQPQTHFYGYPSAQITYSSIVKTALDEPMVFTQFNKQFLINVITKNNQLQCCNSIPYHNTNDTAYHLINTCKLAGAEPSKSEISILGSVEDVNNLVLLLSQYFSNVLDSPNHDYHNYAYSIAKYKNSHWNLFNLLLCE